MELDANVLARHAAYHPDRRAAYFRGRWYTYGELYARAHRAARHLAALGVGPGDRVGLLAHNHLAYLDLFFAAPLLGFALVPFNHRLSAHELEALVRYTRPKVLFLGPEMREKAARLEVPLRPLAALEEEVGAALPAHRPGAEDVALLLFTGGTTGLPKAAMIPYRQLLINAFSTVFSWGLFPTDRYVVATPMFHAALNALATPLLYLGGEVLIQERFDPGEYLAWVEAHRPTLLFMVPTMFQMLVEHPRFPQTDFSSVRFAISGGAPCPAPVREAFRRVGVRFKQGYGLTECGVNCFAMDLEEAEAHPESVGRPVLHLWARIAREDGSEADAGEVGELWLSGPVVMRGYFARPAETQAVFVKAQGRRWLRTGDLAFRDAAGRYYIVGRSKEMFISGGENVYPVEVERVLYDHPAVKEAAVVGVPDPKWGEVGLAAVVLRPGARVSAEELRAFVRARLAGYKVPKRWVFLEALPKSGAGKVLKREIAERYGGTHAEGQG